MAESFHFLQPLWLLILLPLALLIWLLYSRRGGQNPWQDVVDPPFLQLLGMAGKAGGQRLSLGMLALGWTVAAVALANPSWDRQPRPLLQSAEAWILVLDLSTSMLASDLQPSRLEQARYKITDLLRLQDEKNGGRSGLVVFAGDAFVVAPLTRDVETIKAMLDALDPQIMPIQGSRLDLGLQRAGELLQQAGATNGKVLVLCDGYAGEQALTAAAALRSQGHRVSVLGFGTAEGAPVPVGNGKYLRDNFGNVVIAKLDADALQALANTGGGVYIPVRGFWADLNQIVRADQIPAQEQVEETEMESEIWLERGPWLVPLLLPLAALAFRRGWLLGLLLLVGIALPPRQALAFGWQDLWQRREQQATAAMEAGDLQRAAELARDPVRRGVARYRSGDYREALEDFTGADGAEAAYNQGNALARLGEYQKAIKAYDQALASMPDMDDALVNKAAVEKLLQQQQQQQNSQSSDQESSKSGENSEQGGAENGNSQQQGSEESADAEQEQTEEGKEPSDPNGTNESQGSKVPQSPGENQFADAANEDKQQPQEGVAPDDSASDSETTAMESDVPPNDEQASGGNTLDGEEEKATDTESANAMAEELSSEEQIAAEQWLRRIPDDPGGLLRRKFLYQYQQRTPPAGTASQPPW